MTQSQRATAKMLGVGVATVNRDLDGVPDGTEKPGQPAEDKGTNPAAVPDGTPAWFQDDVDPAKLAKTQASRKQKEADRQEQRDENATKVLAAAPIEALRVPAGGLELTVADQVGQGGEPNPAAKGQAVPTRNHDEPVFGLFKRGGRVYTVMIPNALTDTLIPITQGRISK